MRDKNGVEIQVGDWVTWGGHYYAAKVEKIEKAVPNTFWAWGAGSNTAVRVYQTSGQVEVVSRKPAKRRKLTLSQGLAWLRGERGDLRARGEGWFVYVGTPLIGPYPTPLKAIIAARKALGVK